MNAEAADRDVAALLRVLDHPVPNVDVAQFMSRAGMPARQGTLTPSPHVTASARQPRRWRSAAFVVGTVVAAVAAALVPHSPIRTFLPRLERIFVSSSSSRTTPPPVSAAPTRGVAIVPVSGIDVVFRATQSGGIIHVLAGPTTRAAVSGSRADVTYGVGPDSLIVDNRAVQTGDYIVTLPHAAQLPLMRITVGATVVYRRTPSHTDVPSGTPTADGYDIPFVR